MAEGVVRGGQHIPGDELLYRFYNRFGESLPSIALARAAARYMRGRSAESTRRAGKRAVEPLVDLVQPWALAALETHRAEGRPVVLATTSPMDLVSPLAAALGFDDVIATRYGESEGRYTGRLEGGFVWGLGKRTAVDRWATDHHIDLAVSHVYTDSFFDLPLLTAVGHPHPLNADPRLVAVSLARRWPLEYWDRPPGIPSVIGFEPYHLVRPFFRPEAFPYARFDDHRGGPHPGRGTGAAGLQPPELLRRGGHRAGGGPPGSTGTVPGQTGGLRRAGGRVDWPAPSEGSPWNGAAGRPSPCGRPQPPSGPERSSSCSPRGPFPVARRSSTLCCRAHGTARLAAETGAPVVPVGVWGTERVWPRSSRIPNVISAAPPAAGYRHRGGAGDPGPGGRGGRHSGPHGRHRRPPAR